MSKNETGLFSYKYIAIGILLAWIATRSLPYSMISSLPDWPQDVSELILSSEDPAEYDFVVVGAGTSGSIAAGRLSEITGWKILIIEAGDEPTRDSRIPALSFLTHRTKADWNYTTESDERICQGYTNKKCRWTSGRTIGGSSALNAMIYLRGHERDFDEWEESGITGWGYKSVLKYFKKIEKTNKKREGKQNLEYYGTDSAWKRVINNAWEELGYESNIDLYQPRPIGISEVLGTVKNGERLTPADSYLRGMGNNLKMMKNSLVTKIDIDSENKVKGLFVNVKDKQVYIKVKKELILAAGAINTPKLLMLSGIGPKEHLKDLGIPLKQDLAVGENLQDHIIIPMMLSSDVISRELNTFDLAKTYVDYNFFRGGILSKVGLQDLIGFVNTTDKSSTVSNIEIMHTHITKNCYYYAFDALELIGLDKEVLDWARELNKHSDIVVVGVILSKPNSRGFIKLRSSNYKDAPLIIPNFYDDPSDMDTVLEGINFVEKLGNTTSFKENGIELTTHDREQCSYFIKRSRDYWKCYIKYLGGTIYHPTGTAKMGPNSDPKAVVDPDMKVRGIKGLRIIDGSIMPKIVRSNPSGTIMVFGELAADKIKTQWL